MHGVLQGYIVSEIVCYWRKLAGEPFHGCSYRGLCRLASHLESHNREVTAGAIK